MKRLRLFMAMLMVGTILAQIAPTQAQGVLLQARGKIILIHMVDVGVRYGPPSDQIDAEVVVKLDSQPGKAFGFQLRNDANGLVHQGMLSLLRDALNNGWTVTIDYNEINRNRMNSMLIRVSASK